MLDFLIVLLNMIRMFLDEYELIMFNINKYLMLRGGEQKAIFRKRIRKSELSLQIGNLFNSFVKPGPGPIQISNSLLDSFKLQGPNSKMTRDDFIWKGRREEKSRSKNNELR